MAPLAFNLADYRNWVMMSEKKRLLVEGPADKRLFKLLFDALQIAPAQIDIDTADLLVQVPGESGNRARVEAAATIILEYPYAAKFAGFVDREYRSFSMVDPIRDDAPQHTVTGRLVWSRGHSVENYYFDFSVLREPLRTFSVTEFFDTALDIFEPLLPAIILQASSLGLAARDHGLETPVRASLRWQHFSATRAGLQFDSANWHADLQSLQRLDQTRADNLLNAYRAWLPVLTRSDHEVARWICDGHLGLAAIWAAYGASVADACSFHNAPDVPREVSRVLAASESVRFNACAESWTRRALGGQATYPTEVVALLGLAPPRAQAA